MNLNINKNILIAILMLVSLLIIGVVGFALHQTWQGREASTKELLKVRNQLEEIKKIASKKEQFEREIKFSKAEFARYSTSLPKNIFQENVVDMVRGFGEKSQLEVTDLSLNPLETTEKGIKMSIRLSFNGDYSKVATFLSFIHSNVQKVTVPTLTLSGAGKKLSGSSVVDLYGYKDSLYSQNQWDSRLPQGKTDLFKLFEGAPVANDSIENDTTTLQNGTQTQTQIKPIDPVEVEQSKANINSPYDIFLVAGSSNDDAPTVVIGKSNVPGSEIYSDGNKENWVNLYLIETKGKYYFRYKTEFSGYPVGNKTEEFIPTVSGKIVIKVISKQMSNNNDNATVVINLINKTKLQAVVKMNQTSGLPRVEVNPQEGLVNTMYE